MELNCREDVFLQDTAGPTISEHAMGCSNSFKEYMAVPTIFADPTLMDNQYARFKSWASDMDVFGRTHMSLDYKLRYSPTAVEIIHQLLDVISDYLNCLQPIDDPLPIPSKKKRRISGARNAEISMRADDSSDDDTGWDQEDKNLFILNDIVGGTVTRLFRLSKVALKSAKASRTNIINRYTDDEATNSAAEELRIYTESYISFRFPEAPEALRSVLVEANVQRLRRLCYQSSHWRRTQLNFQSPQSFKTPCQPHVASTSTLAAQSRQSIPSKPKNTDKSSDKPGSPLAPITNGTTARQTAIHDLPADSILGASWANSVPVNDELSFPPIPTTNECPYCGLNVESDETANPTAWSEHVLRDLEPFVCLYPHCVESSESTAEPVTFETSDAWISHMHNGHRYVWECRAPSHNPIIYEEETGFQKHAHDEHAVPDAYLRTLSDAARRPAPEKILECPFRDEFFAPKDAEKSPIFLNGALHEHVATHMKQIALLTLHKLTHSDRVQQQ